MLHIHTCHIACWNIFNACLRQYGSRCKNEQPQVNLAFMQMVYLIDFVFCRLFADGHVRFMIVTVSQSAWMYVHICTIRYDCVYLGVSASLSVCLYRPLIAVL